MTLNVTLSLFAACVAVAVFAGWRGARPLDFAKGPRMIPWRFIMLLATAAALPFLVHLVNLLGVRTGR